MFEANLFKARIEKIIGELNIVKKEENNSYTIFYKPNIYVVIPAPPQGEEMSIEKMKDLIEASGDNIVKNPAQYGININRIENLSEEKRDNYVATAVVTASGIAVSEYVNLEITPPPAGDQHLL